VSDIHFHFHFENPGVLPAIEQLKEQMTMNQTELAAALTAVGDQLSKATNEIVVAISNAGVTLPAVDAAVARLQAAAQALDDLNPDTPPVA
jgi:hypothetical protein